MIEDSAWVFNVIDGLRLIRRVGMSTTMTERDSQAAVAVFRSLPQRGGKGHNDRLLLEASSPTSAAEALRQMEQRVEAVRASKAAVFEMFFDHRPRSVHRHM
jgi:hypothetical protein